MEYSIPTSAAPRLSIIMTCHRKNRWLAEALDSIFNSGYHFRDTEFLICDDASPSGGDGATAEAYAAKHPGLLRVLHNPARMGGPASHNRLLKEARGKYILVFDSDDIFVPFDIDSSLDFLDRHPEYAATFGKKQLFSAAKGYWGVSHGGDYSTFAMLLDPRVTHNAMIFRAADVRPEWAYRLPSGKMCKAIVDIPLWTGLGLQKPLRFINENRAFYRMHDHQVTEENKEEFLQDYELLRDELLALYPELVEKAQSHHSFRIRMEDVLPLTMVAGVLFHRAHTREEQMYYLDLAEQVKPDDYAIPEYRIRLFMEDKRYSEALAEVCRMQIMHPDAQYIRMLTVKTAMECMQGMNMDSTRWQKEQEKISRQFFYLSPEQQELLNTAISNARAFDR